MTQDSATTSTPSLRWPAIGLGVVILAFFFLRLGNDLPLRTHEALVAETARNMVLGQGVTLSDGSQPSAWLVPNFDGVPRLRKPPLPYWTVAALALVAGEVNEWTARLPSAVAAVGTVLLVALLVRRRTDRPTALLAAAALATSFGFFNMARMAMADMSMTFFTTAAFAAVWLAVESAGRRRAAWLALAGAAGGLAMLAKGPTPMVVLPVPCLVAGTLMVARLARSPRGSPGLRAEWAWLLAGVAASKVLFWAVTLPWPVYVHLNVPGALEIWRAESVDRSMGDLGRQEPPWFYILRLPALVAPWTLFFLHGLVLATNRVRHDVAARPWLLYLGAWLIGPLVAFSIAAGKQDHYLLPILPAAAVYIALSLRRLMPAGVRSLNSQGILTPADDAARPTQTGGVGSPGRSAPDPFTLPAAGTRSDTASAEKVSRRILLVLAIAVMVVGLAGAAALVWKPAPLRDVLGSGALPPVEEWAVHSAALAIVLILLVGGIVATALARRRPAMGFAVLVVTFVAAYLVAWPTLIGPLDRATTAARFGRQARAYLVPQAAAFGFIETNNTVIFYARHPLEDLPSVAAVEAEIRRGRPVYLVCRDKHRAALASVPGLEEVLHETDPLRPDDGFWLLRAGK